MKLSTHNLGEGNMKTAFQNFMETYHLLLLTVKVQCPKCGHIWGIKVDDYDYSTDIPEKKFKCEQCGHYQASGDDVNNLHFRNGGGGFIDSAKTAGIVRGMNAYVEHFAFNADE